MDDSPTSSLFSCISFNCHGFNQGITCLQSLCDDNTSVIFLQETWLSLEYSALNFNCFAADYKLFYSSAMEDKLSSNILRGRPFGGLCTLINKKICDLFSSVICICAKPNYIIVKADNLLFIKIYFPSAVPVSSRDSLSYS